MSDSSERYQLAERWSSTNGRYGWVIWDTLGGHRVSAWHADIFHHALACQRLNAEEASRAPRSGCLNCDNAAAQGQREPQYVYAESREEAQRLLDNSYLKKYRAVPASPFHERFWWLPVATVAAGFLALTGVLVWLSYFGPWSHV